MRQFSTKMNQLVLAISSKNTSVWDQLTVSGMVEAVDAISVGIKVDDSTVNNENMLAGVIGYGADGTRYVGQIEQLQLIKDVETNTITVSVGYNPSQIQFTLVGGTYEGINVEPADVVKDVTYLDGKLEKQTGQMVGRTLSFTASQADQQGGGGYCTSVKVRGDQDLLPQNIKYGVEIFGVKGSFTSDATATADKLLYGCSAYAKGQMLVGTIPVFKDQIEWASDLEKHSIHSGYYRDCTLKIDPKNIEYNNIKMDVDILGVKASFTADATATADTILSSYTAYVKGQKVIGTIPQFLGNQLQLTSLSSSMADAYYSSCSIRIVDQDIVPQNIKTDVTMLGISGTFTEDANATGNSIIVGYIAYAKGAKIEGQLEPQKEAFLVDELEFAIVDGYYSSTTAEIKSGIVDAAIIKKEVDILGVVGTYTGCDCDGGGGGSSGSGDSSSSSDSTLYCPNCFRQIYPINMCICPGEGPIAPPGGSSNSTPSTPSLPSTPSTPSSPSGSSTPSTPSQPSTPSLPSTPSTPSTPSGGSSSDNPWYPTQDNVLTLGREHFIQFVVTYHQQSAPQYNKQTDMYQPSHFTDFKVDGEIQQVKIDAENNRASWKAQAQFEGEYIDPPRDKYTLKTKQVTLNYSVDEGVGYWEFFVNGTYGENNWSQYFGQRVKQQFGNDAFQNEGKTIAIPKILHQKQDWDLEGDLGFQMTVQLTLYYKRY